VKPGTEETTKIESLAYRGEGIGHIQNKVIFVPLTAPGDCIKVKIMENKRNYLRGTLDQFVSRSPHRIVPYCDYFGECGGCHWQHLRYEYQLEAKESILRDTLTRIGKVKTESFSFEPSIPSPLSLGYRSRVRLQCLTHRTLLLGFFRSQSKEIIPVNRCEIGSDFLNDIVKKLGEFLNSLDYFVQFEEVEILANPEKEEAALSFAMLSPMDDELAKEFLRSLKVAIPKVYGVSFETRQEEDTKIEHFGNCGLTFQFSFTPLSNPDPISIRLVNRIHTFSQVNLEQNQNLLRTIYDWAAPTEETVILDLFCGSGNLSLPLAKKAKRVIGIENNPLAVEDARENAALNDLNNCEFYETNIYNELKEINDLGKVDVLILDPPRKGAKECIGEITTLKPRKILYVSCNPTTLSRDVSLLAYSRYKLTKIQLLDMFPQTYHIECIAEFLLDE